VSRSSESSLGSPLIKALRRVLERSAQPSPIIEPGTAGSWRPAAVLIPIIQRVEGATILLTQRTEHLHHHPGQISFPGGRAEDQDASARETALRETEEEIGLPRQLIEILGRLPEYRTGTGFAITPLIGLVFPPFKLRLDRFEVAEAFEIPLTCLLDPGRWERHRFQYQGSLRECHAITYEGRFIWGATADMLASLSGLLARSIQNSD
jgi:8-oxo-dGTP pyrophosphatase MutT (NUDIX family)